MHQWGSFLKALELFGSLSVVTAQAFRASKLQSECGTLYEVVSGDGCWSIAGAARISQAQLAALNPELDCGTLQVGQGLCLALPCAKTYEVVSGDWCAKIQEEQSVSEEDLVSLNPGFACADLFPSQRLCVAAPTPTVPTDPLPTGIPPPVQPPLPEPACRSRVLIAQGDTCYNLATGNGLQLAQFYSLNPNLNCTTMGAGDSACVQGACDQIYRVQEGDWCSKIEQSFSLSSGKLIELNPSLDCNLLSADQVVCVKPATQTETPIPTSTAYSQWDQFPVLAPGSTLKSPLLDFVDSDDPYNTFMGESVFQLDSQHKAIFNRLDLNKDGKLDQSELQTMIKAHPLMTNGVANRESNLGPTKAVTEMLKAADLDGDGSVSESEYMAAVFQAQNATHSYAELALKRRSGELGAHEKRFIDLIIYGGILLMLGLAMILDVMDQMQYEALQEAGDLLKYLDVTFWDRNGSPPSCSAYIYYSDSCGTLWSKAASKCSHGGKKVFKESCNGFITSGSKACGFLCSSMCWSINTNGCECDALNYTAETNRIYQDPPLSSSTVSGTSACRKKCGSTSGCIGFSVEMKDDAQVTCRVYNSMTSPKQEEHATSFRVSKSDTCDPIPPGYSPLSAEQMRRYDQDAERLAEDYAADHAASLTRRVPGERTLPDNYDPRPKFTTLDEYAEILAARAPPNSLDLRTQYRTTVKNQGKTGMCTSFSVTTMVEGSIKKKYSRTTNNDLSPVWVHRCIAKLDKERGAQMRDHIDKVYNTKFLARESCMPFSTVDNPKCIRSGCGSPDEGQLPYLTRTPHFEPGIVIGSAASWNQIKTHLIDYGPVTQAFTLNKAFGIYAQTLASKPNNEVFYGDHPDYPGHDCPLEGHQMTIVGYGHFKKGGTGRDRLYWIVQNSWGVSSGQNGYVYIMAGSLGSGDKDAYGVEVSERVNREEL